MRKGRFDRETHSHYLGQTLLSGATDILKGVGILKVGFATDFDMWRGEATHKCIEYYLKGTLDYSTVDESIKPRLDAFIEFEKNTGFKADQIEAPIQSDALMVGTIPDIIGHFPSGKRAIVEEKSGAVYSWTAIQTAIQSLVLNNGQIDKDLARFGLSLPAKGRPGLIEFTDLRDFTVAISSINIYNWQRNHGGVK